MHTLVSTHMGKDYTKRILKTSFTWVIETMGQDNRWHSSARYSRLFYSLDRVKRKEKL